jgi:elongation factor Ts
MADVTAQMVKELRERTGAGMMDCKNALVEAGGDAAKAAEIIQKKGLAKAVKAAGRIAADGMIVAEVAKDASTGVLVEVNCQTDFVARSPDFKAFVDVVGMQIASMSAQYVRREEVPAADIAKQSEIFQAQLEEETAQSGKKRPAEVLAKIVQGKIDKWLDEVCLEQQPAITDQEKTVASIAGELSATIGEKIVVRRFVRFELGEGLDKKQSDLAAEVAATLAAS